MMKNPERRGDDRVFTSERIELIKRGKKGGYVARFRVNGITTTKSLDTSNLEVAKKRARVIDAQLVSGAYGKADVADENSCDITIRDAVTKYIDHKRDVEKRRPKTIWKYDGALGDFVAWCETRKLTMAAEMSVRAFRDYEAFFAKSHEPKTTHCVMIIIKGLFIWLGPRGQGILSSEPLAAAKLTKARARPKYKPAKQHIDAIVAKATGEAKVQLKTLAMTGLRVNELANLRPVDVDLDGGWIHVRVRADWAPKTHEAREIPIHPELIEDLRALSKASRPWFFRGLPVGSRVPTKVNDRRLLLYLQAIATELEIPIKRENAGIVIHSFRDYFETSTVNSGVPQFVVDAWMGHAGGGTMGKTYYGLTPEKSKEWMEKVRF